MQRKNWRCSAGGVRYGRVGGALQGKERGSPEGVRHREHSRVAVQCRRSEIWGSNTGEKSCSAGGVRNRRALQGREARGAVKRRGVV